MFNKAIDKLRDEMADNAGFDLLTELGEMLCGYLRTHRAAAEQILAEGKTLSGAIGALEEYARKNRGRKDCVHIPPEKAKKLVLEYYGIREGMTRWFDISLDELRGI